MSKKKEEVEKWGVPTKVKEAPIHVIPRVLCPRCNRAMAVHRERKPVTVSGVGGQKTVEKDFIIYNCPDCGTKWEEEIAPKGVECFIATACYGSSLEAPVSFLREFRDGEVKKTKIGKQFMRCFNKIYYFFSPAIAKFIKQHRYARVFIKNLLIAPLIHLLMFSERVTHPIRNREIRVFATGALTTLMIFLILYVVIFFIGSVF